MKILVILNSTYKWLWIPLSEQLVKHYKANVVLIASNQSQYNYFRDKIKIYKTRITLKILPNIYGHIINNKLDHDVDFNKIIKYEKKYNVPITKKIIFSDRQLGRDYYISGPNFARTKVANNINFKNRLNAIDFSFNFWEEEVIKLKPDLIVTIGGMFNITFSPLKIIANKKNIPIRNLTTARVDDYFYWAKDDLGTLPDNLQKKFKNYYKISLSKLEMSKTIKRKADLTDKIIISGQSRTKISRIPIHLIRKSRDTVVSFLKNKEKYMQGISFLSYFKYLINGAINQKYNDYYGKRKLCNKALKKSVFFPLQMVPEYTSLNLGWAHDQLNLILEISLNLPIDYKLIVKEHYFAMNARSISFYKFIKKLPNVELIHPSINGKYLAENSCMVIAISSTALYEAALYGKPVITFEDSNYIRDLPHVFKIDSAKEIEKIREIIKKFDSAFEQKIAKENSLKMQKLIANNLFSIKGNLGYLNLHNFSSSLSSLTKIDEVESKILRKKLKKSSIIAHLIDSLPKKKN